MTKQNSDTANAAYDNLIYCFSIKGENKQDYIDELERTK
tara:strand:+ start:555 stop:671 length:117 start_codon:yes stop_codon:yes gene_type:complete